MILPEPHVAAFNDFAFVPGLGVVPQPVDHPGYVAREPLWQVRREVHIELWARCGRAWRNRPVERQDAMAGRREQPRNMREPHCPPDIADARIEGENSAWRGLDHVRRESLSAFATRRTAQGGG